MRYIEYPPPSGLEGHVAAIWSLDCGGSSTQDLEHHATPDGCIELIWRQRGRSCWKRPQPDMFATGLSAAPAILRISGDAVFLAVRLWPWAWNRIGGTKCRTFAGDWIAVEPGTSLATLVQAGRFMPEALQSAFSHCQLHPIAAAIPKALSVADIVAESGKAIRTVQRWCREELGVEPRRYLRQLRFGRTIRNIGQQEATLADYAAMQGYADQSHMAREFRALAGDVARNVRVRAQGPFI